jgi:hypothetical protein
MKRVPILFAAIGGFLCLIGMSDYAHAEVVAACGPSVGTGYYLMTSAIPTKDAGWKGEKEEAGAGFQLVRNGADFDIFFTDALGTKSAKADGGTVLLGSTNEQLGIMNILVTYSGTGVLESYLFNLAARNVVYTVTKTRTLVPLARLLVASCQ